MIQDAAVAAMTTASAALIGLWLCRTTRPTTAGMMTMAVLRAAAGAHGLGAKAFAAKPTAGKGMVAMTVSRVQTGSARAERKLRGGRRRGLPYRSHLHR